MSVPYENELNEVTTWEDAAPTAAPTQQQQRHTPPQQARSLSPPQQQQPQPSTSPRSTPSPSKRPATTGSGRPLPSPRKRPRTLLIPLRSAPVTVAPAPFAPPPWKAPPLKLAPGSASARSKFMKRLDDIAAAGSARRERTAEKLKESRTRAASKSGAQWRSCATPRDFFSVPPAGDEPGKVAAAPALSPEEREAVVARLVRVPPPRKPLPPLVAKWSMSDEDEEALVARLTQPFEREEVPPPPRRIIDDEELDEMIQRLYAKPLEKMFEAREARGV